MKVLGIDPGFGRMGWAIVEIAGSGVRAIEFGCVETKSVMSFAERLLVLSDELRRLIKKFHPEVVAVEELFFAKNVKTAIQVAHGRGVIILAAAQAGLPIVEVKPAEVKQTIAGNGNADKKQVQKMVQIIFGLKAPLKSDDAADALAVALTGGSRARWEKKTK
ncbi:MAG: crossover junction endodeoxyribonuclease RuvC [Candidatus Magasanikbacteria bacterium]|nr:crossover junction endodeoxyribonuclease RuvC [Candidatus Magasanikbacteria bacterium]